MNTSKIDYQFENYKLTRALENIKYTVIYLLNYLAKRNSIIWVVKY